MIGSDPVPSRRRDALLALSIANLTLLAVWANLAATRFFLVGPAAVAAPAVVVINLTLLTALLYGLFRAGRALGEPAGHESCRVIVLLSLILPADWLGRQVGGPAFSSVMADSVSSVVIAVIVMAALAVPGVRRRLSAAVELLLISLVPAVLFSLFQAGMSLASYPSVSRVEVPCDRPSTGTSRNAMEPLLRPASARGGRA